MRVYMEEAVLFKTYRMMDPVTEKWVIKKDTPPDIKKRLEKYIKTYVYPEPDKNGVVTLY